MKIKTETDIRENTLISQTKYVFFRVFTFVSRTSQTNGSVT